MSSVRSFIEAFEKNGSAQQSLRPTVAVRNPALSPIAVDEYPVPMKAVAVSPSPSKKPAVLTPSPTQPIRSRVSALLMDALPDQLPVYQSPRQARRSPPQNEEPLFMQVKLRKVQTSSQPVEPKKNCSPQSKPRPAALVVVTPPKQQQPESTLRGWQSQIDCPPLTSPAPKRRVTIVSPRSGKQHKPSSLILYNQQQNESRWNHGSDSIPVPPCQRPRGVTKDRDDDGSVHEDDDFCGFDPDSASTIATNSTSGFVQFDDKSFASAVSMATSASSAEWMNLPWFEKDHVSFSDLSGSTQSCTKETAESNKLTVSTDADAEASSAGRRDRGRRHSITMIENELASTPRTSNGRHRRRHSLFAAGPCTKSGITQLLSPSPRDTNPVVAIPSVRQLHAVLLKIRDQDLPQSQRLDAMLSYTRLLQSKLASVERELEEQAGQEEIDFDSCWDLGSDEAQI